MGKKIEWESNYSITLWKVHDGDWLCHAINVDIDAPVHFEPVVEGKTPAATLGEISKKIDDHQRLYKS